jgi:hypothetical protein
MTFLLSEDEALRKQIQGITVHDQRATGDNVPRQVGVFFGQPDQELRAQVYPYITIDMIDLQRDSEREMRGRITGDVNQFGYLGPTETFSNHYNWDIELPIPVNIDYQITTYARQPRHDRELLSQLLHVKLPLRFGQLTLNDNTVRRLEVLDVAKRDTVEQAKRLFINAVTVRVTSEIVQAAYQEYYTVYNGVHIATPEIINHH